MWSITVGRILTTFALLHYCEEILTNIAIQSILFFSDITQQFYVKGSQNRSHCTVSGCKIFTPFMVIFNN